MKLKPEIKAAWLQALRSGDYEQGVNRLRSSGGGFCCLGVLCDVASKRDVGQWVEREVGRDNYAFSTGPGETETSVLPATVSRWAFERPGTLFHQWDPRVTMPEVHRHQVNPDNAAAGSCLSSFNDNGYTFNQIADAIEESL